MHIAVKPTVTVRSLSRPSADFKTAYSKNVVRLCPSLRSANSRRSNRQFYSRDTRAKVATVPTTTRGGDESSDDELTVLTVNTKIAQEEDFELAKAALEKAVASKEPEVKSEVESESDEGERRWLRLKKISAFQRTLEIWGFVVKFLFKRWWVEQKWGYENKEITPEAKSAKLSILAVWVRKNLVKLGPTFIKAGQQFSTRVDVLSKEFVKELEQLQDNVPGFGAAEAKRIVEEQLGAPLDEKFSYFEDQPIAAASLGQVHIAKIGDETVVVKVQRPGLKQLFDIDLKNIRVLASFLQAVDPKTDGAARDWVAIYDECANVLYQEIDYRKEGENADAFRRNFAPYDWAKIPHIFWEYSSEKVLTMEYCPGIKINRVDELDRLGLDRARLARLTVEAYLLQILKFGLFHADPHPGNIAVDPKSSQIIYYDFGMMGNIQGGVRTGLNKLFYSIYSRNADEALVALKMMGVFVPTGDDTAVKRTAQFFLNSFYERLETQTDEREVKGEEYSKEFKAQRSKDDKKARRKQILNNIGEDLLLVSKDQPFRFPATFTFVIRAFTVLDGLGKSLDKKFDISEISRPYARDLLMDGKPPSARVQQAVIKRAIAQSQAFVNLIKGPDRVEELANTVSRLENGDLKLRVRALDAERALVRVQAMQTAQGQGMVAAAALNVGTVLYVSELATVATVAFGAAGLFSLLALGGIMKVAKLAKKDATYAAS